MGCFKGRRYWDAAGAEGNYSTEEPVMQYRGAIGGLGCWPWRWREVGGGEPLFHQELSWSTGILPEEGGGDGVHSQAEACLQGEEEEEEKAA